MDSQNIILALIVAMFVIFIAVLGGANLYVMISDWRDARRIEKEGRAAKMAVHQDKPPSALAA